METKSLTEFFFFFEVQIKQEILQILKIAVREITHACIHNLK